MLQDWTAEVTLIAANDDQAASDALAERLVGDGAGLVCAACGAREVNALFNVRAATAADALRAALAHPLPQQPEFAAFEVAGLSVTRADVFDVRSERQVR